MISCSSSFPPGVTGRIFIEGEDRSAGVKIVDGQVVAYGRTTFVDEDGNVIGEAEVEVPINAPASEATAGK